MDLNRMSGGIGLVGAVLLLSGSGYQAASAQGNGSDVVLPGDVPIKGSSSRGWPGPAAGTTATTTTTTTTVTTTAAPADQTALMNRGEQLNQRLQALNIEPPLAARYGPSVVPGMTANSPTAYGGFSGMGALGVAYQNKTRFNNKNDGVAGAVISFGSPQTAGVDLALTANNLTNRSGQGGFGHRTSFSFKIHKPISNDLAVAFGADDAIARHRTFDQRSSYYGVVSKGLMLKPDPNAAFSRLDLSLGVGNGRFQTEPRVFAGKNGLGVFGSAAIQASNQVRPFVEWTGQDMNVGVSLVPIRSLPIVVTPAFLDVAHRNGHTTRFGISAAWLFGVGK